MTSAGEQEQDKGSAQSQNGDGSNGPDLVRSLNAILDVLTHTKVPLFEANLAGLRVEDARPGWIKASLPVTARIRNRMNTLHGGCTATIVDVVTTLALATVSKRLGVSLQINTTYMAPIGVGETVEITAKVEKVGSTIAHVSAELRNQGSRVMAAQGHHVKFLKAKNSHETYQQTADRLKAKL